MNADWLFQNYFGEYGIPQELKSAMLPEIQMVANGFALEYATGRDVQKSIDRLDTAMTMARLNGELDMLVTEMVEGFEQEKQEENTIQTDTNATEAEDVNLTQEQKEAIAQSIAEDKAYAKWQKEIAEKYHLPYDIPGRVNKYFVYSANMKASKGGHGGKSKRFKVNLDTWHWRDGDFFWVNAGSQGWFGKAKIWGHVGFVSEPKYGQYHNLCKVIDNMPKGKDRRYNVE